MAPDDSSRAAYETHARSAAMLAHTRKQAETVNPETRRGQYACLLLRGNELRSHTASALRMSLTTALAEPLGETDRSRFDSFFLLEWTGRNRRVSFRDSSSREHNRRRRRDSSYRNPSIWIVFKNVHSFFFFFHLITHLLLSSIIRSFSFATRNYYLYQ